MILIFVALHGSMGINRSSHGILKLKTKNKFLKKFYIWNVTYLVSLDSENYVESKNAIIYRVFHLKIKSWCHFRWNRKWKKIRLCVKKWRLLGIYDVPSFKKFPWKIKKKRGCTMILLHTVYRVIQISALTRESCLL